MIFFLWVNWFLNSRTRWNFLFFNLFSHFGRANIGSNQTHYITWTSTVRPSPKCSKTKKSTIYENTGRCIHKITWSIKVHYWVRNKCTQGENALSWPPKFDPGDRDFRIQNSSTICRSQPIFRLNATHFLQQMWKVICALCIQVSRGELVRPTRSSGFYINFAAEKFCRKFAQLGRVRSGTARKRNTSNLAQLES
jgi:hypothetical protein